LGGPGAEWIKNICFWGKETENSKEDRKSSRRKRGSFGGGGGGGGVVWGNTNRRKLEADEVQCKTVPNGQGAKAGKRNIQRGRLLHERRKDEKKLFGNVGENIT